MLAPVGDHFSVNPYTRWVHDHPATLLPEPTPALLQQKRAAQPLGSGRLIVELGSGSGNFLLQHALRFPHDHLVGFELRFKRLVRAARKLEKAGLRRVWLLREEAQNFADFFAPGSVDRAHLHFPDPWPKFSQWKKRLLTAPFLDRLETALRPGGTLHLKTDHSGYFLHSLSLFRGRPGWRIGRFSNDLHRRAPPAPNLSTEFEQLFVAKHKPIFFLEAVKTGGTG